MINDIRNLGVEFPTLDNTDFIPVQKATGQTGRINGNNLLSGVNVSSSAERGYSQQVLFDTPDYYYRLNEASGTTANDSSGFIRNGIYSGSYSLGQDSLLIGDANFSYKNSTASFIDFANIYNSTNWTDSNGITIECLIKLDAANTNGCIFTLGQNNASNIYTGFSVWSFNGSLYIDIAGIASQTFPQAFGTGINHIAVAVRKTYGQNLPTFLMNFNGKQVASYTPPSFNIPNAIAHIGKTNWGGNLNAWIDEFAVYGCELPQNRIYAHYKSSLLAA